MLRAWRGKLAKLLGRVSLYEMSAAIANDKIPDVETEAHEITRRQMQVWFEWMDRILDVHRANFVFREATPRELDQHKAALRLAISWSACWSGAIAVDAFGRAQTVN